MRLSGCDAGAELAGCGAPSAGAYAGGRVEISRREAGQLSVQLWLPARLWQALPLALQQGSPVHCHVALISQGINAQQTVANAIGETELQVPFALETR